MPDLNAMVQEWARREQERKQKDYHEACIQYYGRIWEKASAYTKLITAAGYGGFFAAWSAAGAYLTAKEAVASILAITVSLLVFVAWEVFQMVGAAFYLNADMERNLKISIVDYPKVNKRLNEAAARRAWLWRWAWYPVLIITVFSGFTGGVILLFGLLRHAIRG